MGLVHVEQRIAQKMEAQAQTGNRRGRLMPVIVTIIVAAVGAAGILDTLRAGNTSPDGRNARMITAAAVSRVGAIEIPTEPPAGVQRGVPT
jgi:hypothetical protein